MATLYRRSQKSIQLRNVNWFYIAFIMISGICLICGSIFPFIDPENGELMSNYLNICPLSGLLYAFALLTALIPSFLTDPYQVFLFSHYCLWICVIAFATLSIYKNKLWRYIPYLLLLFDLIIFFVSYKNIIHYSSAIFDLLIWLLIVQAKRTEQEKVRQDRQDRRTRVKGQGQGDGSKPLKK